MCSYWICFSAGFAWILPGRPVNVFPSTGQTLVWRKLRLLHTEGVCEWLSGHNQYLNSYTNPCGLSPPNTHTHTHPCCPPRTFLLLCPNHTHAALLCSCHCVVPTQTHLDWSTCRTKTKMKWHKKNHEMLLYIWLIFLACLCAFSLSWAFLLTVKAMVWNYFLILALPVVKRCLLCLDGFLPKKKEDKGNYKKMRNVMN